MKKYAEHSIRGYLSRLPAYKLEQVLKTRGLDNTVLTADDYVFIQDLLRSHPDHAVKDEDYQPHR